jgi:hypothetical protein
MEYMREILKGQFHEFHGFHESELLDSMFFFEAYEIGAGGGQ